MDFQKRLKQRLYVAVAYIILGLTLIAGDFLIGFENYFFFSFGFALTVMGILRLIRHRKITRDAKTIRQQELIETDERNLMLAERARSWAFSFSVMAAGALVIVLNLLGYHDAALPYAWFVCAMVLLYWIFWMVIRRKY